MRNGTDAMSSRLRHAVSAAVLTLVFLPPSVLQADEPRTAASRPGSNQWSYVCQDAGAGGYEAFPDVCRLNDGRLMAVFYAGYDHVSLPNERWPQGGRISCCTSSNEGQTWSEPRVLYDGPDDDRDPSIIQLKSGRTICNFFQLRKADSGYQFHGSWMVVSEDTGRSWSAPRLIAEQYACSSPSRELPDGRLILGLYRETEKSAIGAVIISEDGGNTWGRTIDIDNGGHRFDAETDVLRLKDGSLYAIQRSPGDSMGYSISKDGGRTWSVSKLVGFPGHCPYLLRSPDDVIVLAHRLPNTSLHYSSLIACRTPAFTTAWMSARPGARTSWSMVSLGLTPRWSTSRTDPC
jgi:sialidase-1